MIQKKHISILALKNANYASIVDARSVFRKVNELLKAQGTKEMFEIQIVGERSEIVIEDGLVTIKADLASHEVDSTDLIIIPALRGDMLITSHYNRFFVDWIIKQYKRNAEVASLCTGAFMLAFTGLLKNKKCTTHWQYANEFRFFYPDINLVDGKIIVEQNGLYSSGGSNAYWNLLLFLVEKFVSREMAILVAKYFVVNLDKIAQTPFIVFNGLKEHNDDKVCYFDSQTFRELFKRITGLTPVEYKAKYRENFNSMEISSMAPIFAA